MPHRVDKGVPEPCSEKMHEFFEKRLVLLQQDLFILFFFKFILIEQKGLSLPDNLLGILVFYQI